MKTIMYIDGRDPNAKPPLTIRNVTVWDLDGDYSRAKFTLHHGTAATVLGEEKGLIKIKHRLRTGGVIPSFLSAEKPDIIGDLI